MTATITNIVYVNKIYLTGFDKNKAWNILSMRRMQEIHRYFVSSIFTTVEFEMGSEACEIRRRRRMTKL